MTKETHQARDPKWPKSVALGKPAEDNDDGEDGSLARSTGFDAGANAPRHGGAGNCQRGATKTQARAR